MDRNNTEVVLGSAEGSERTRGGVLMELKPLEIVDDRNESANKELERVRVMADKVLVVQPPITCPRCGATVDDDFCYCEA